MNPDVSVVITTFQQPAQLLKCLDALERQSLPRHQFEVIVVDDGDSPATATAVALFTRQLNQQHGALDIQYLPQPIRRGSAAARNRGWQVARGRVIAFTDDDCLPQPTWLANALPCFRDDTAFVMGQLSVQLPHPSEPIRANELLADPVSVVSANCFCLRSALDQLGGFSETVYGRQANALLLASISGQALPMKISNDALVIRYTPDLRAPASHRTQPVAGLPISRPKTRQPISTDQSALPVYWVAISGAFTGLMGLLTGSLLLTLAGFSVWISLSALFGQRNQAGIPQLALLTSIGIRLTTPFVSVYWQLYSTVKYGVMHR